MGMGVEDARGLTLWEYEAILTEHNLRVRNALGTGPIEPPDPEAVERRLAKLRTPQFMN